VAISSFNHLSPGGRELERGGFLVIFVLPAFLLGASIHGFHLGMVRDIIESRRLGINTYGQLPKEGIDAIS